MSVFAQSWAWKFNIPSVPKLVLIAIADQSDDDGEVRYRDISAEFFSQKCGMNLRNFKRHIHALEHNGYLRKTVGGGRGNGTEFFLELGRAVSPMAEWVQPEIHPKEPLAGKNMTDSTRFTDGKPCQIRHGLGGVNYVESDMVSGSLHYTRDQSKESTSARARASDVGTRAHARDERAVTQEDFKLTKELILRGQWVYRGTRAWDDLEALAKRNRLLMPIAVYVQTGDPPHKNGRHFPKWLWQRALDEAAVARGPPKQALETEASESESSGSDHARQSATRLRRDALDDRAGYRPGVGKSSHGGSNAELAC